jgi:type I restriction enzyme, S subunit
MNNISTEGRFDWSKIRRVPIPAKGLNGLAVQAGDVLFNHTNSPELVGKAAYFAGHNEVITFSNHFLRLRPRSERLDEDISLGGCRLNRRGMFFKECAANG